MSTPPIVRQSAPRRYTSAVLTSGVVISALCFVVAAIAELAGSESPAGDMTNLGVVADGLRALAPWAWATLGSYVVVLTPFVALLVTIAEYVSIGERRTVLTALAVLAILTVSVVVALLR